jgi:hypothetical protein
LQKETEIVAQVQYAFIILAPGYEAAVHHAILESPEFKSRVVGVSSPAAALNAVDGLVAEGVEIIELCGGFTPQQSADIGERAGTGVSVGLVVYNE